VQINLGARRINCKLVYYGPGYSGKTTNIQKVHEHTPKQRKSDLTSIATEGDRTLFFDYMSLDLGQVMGMDTCFQLYTVPGQVYYDATRKLVLQGVDGLVFVADSSPDRVEANVESWENLLKNLGEYGLTLDDIPVVIQYNKRDVPGAVPVEKLNGLINKKGFQTTEAVATEGTGVLETLKLVCGMVFKKLSRKASDAKRSGSRGPIQQAPAQPAPVAANASKTPSPAVAAAVASARLSPAAARPSRLATVALNRESAPVAKPVGQVTRVVKQSTNPVVRPVTMVKPTGSVTVAGHVKSKRRGAGWAVVAALLGLAAVVGVVTALLFR